MSVIRANAFVLSQASAFNADYPVAGYENLATVATLTATQADTDFPASNLCNPATNLLWKSGSTADQYVTVLFVEGNEVDYVGLARHNLGSGAVAVTVQGLPPGGDPDEPTDWDDLVAQQLLDGDGPALFRFDPVNLIGIRLKLEPDTVEPQAAVFYVGKLLVFERGVQPGHTPIPYARQRNVTSPRSQSGEYLGRVVSGGVRTSSVSFSKFTPEWFRSSLDPFLDASVTQPFFWAWSPLRYPKEVGYVWLTNDPRANPADLNEYYDITLQMEGLLL